MHYSVHSQGGMHSRPQSHTAAPSATVRQETEMAEKYLRKIQDGCPDSDPMERLRSLCLSRGGNGILALGRIFRRMDKEGKNQLSKEEFLKGLKHAGLEISDDEVEAIFDKFYDYERGGLNVNEFLIHVRPPMAEGRKSVIDEAFTKMAMAGHKEYKDTDEKYKDKYEYITVADFRRTYNVKAHPLYISGEEDEDKIIERLLADFTHDATRDGHVTYEEFVNYYSAISASIDNDCYFNLMMRQAFKL